MTAVAPIHGETWEDYTKSTALGSSALHAWGSMGLEAWGEASLGENRYNDGKPKSKPITKGSALDLLVTGGEEAFAAKYAEVQPGFTKASWAEAVDEIRAAAPFAREAIGILADGAPVHYQTTLRGEIGGLQVQTRPDIWIDRPGHPLLVDLKYVSQPEKFHRDFLGSRYEIQAGIDHIFQPNAEIAFLLVESETTQPRTTIVLLKDEFELSMFAKRTADRCREIKAAQDSPRGLVDVVQITTLNLPPWARKQLEESA